jgi:hypothetical protein
MSKVPLKRKKERKIKHQFSLSLFVQINVKRVSN